MQSSFINTVQQLSTLTTLYSSYIPTFAFVYPINNISSVYDLQFYTTPQNHYFSCTTSEMHTSATTPKSTTFTTAPKAKITTKNPRKKNEKKEIESAKKNSESNLVNQLYSYFNCFEKSQRIVEKAIKSLKENPPIEKVKNIFYNIVRLINFKRGRRYVNKASILNYYSPENYIKNIGEVVEQLQKVGLITLEEFCYIFRVCTFHFMRDVSLNAVLTSKRITTVSRDAHLKRRRKVVASLRQRDTE